MPFSIHMIPVRIAGLIRGLVRIDLFREFLRVIVC